MKKTAVIVGASGTATAFGFIQSIIQHWGNRAEIIAIDTNPPELNASSIFSSRYYMVPPVGAIDHNASMARIFESVKLLAPVFVPIMDSEILWAARQLETEMLPQNLRVALPSSAENIACCNNKLSAHNAMNAARIRNPYTVSFGQRDEIPFPCLMKPKYGVGSVTRVLSTVLECEGMQDSEDASSSILQTICSGPEITIDVFRGRPNGPNQDIFRAICRERLQVKAGVASKCRVFEDSQLTDLALQVANCFDLWGAFCFQVMKSQDDGHWNVIDINPRPGGGTRMSAAIGLDFMAAALADCLGESVSACLRLSPLESEAFVVRQPAEYVTKPS